MLLNGQRRVNPFCQVYGGDQVWATSPLSQRSQQKHNTNDAPAYLEVDELCAGFVLLFEPAVVAAAMPRSAQLTPPFLTLKCYN